MSPSLLMLLSPAWLEHLSPVKNKSNSKDYLSLACCPPLSRPPRHRFGPGTAFLPLCPSEPHHGSCGKPSAHRVPRSPARQCWRSDCDALSLELIELGRKIMHCLKVFLHNETNFIGSYMVSSIRHEEARQSQFLLLPCLEARATPSHENGDGAPANPASTRQRSPTSATTMRSLEVPCSGYTHEHNTPKQVPGNKEKRLSPASNRGGVSKWGL